LSHELNGQWLKRMERLLAERQRQILDEHLYVRSSVLLPLVEYNNEPGLLFEVRAHHLKRQPGEICFPGGRVDAADPDDAAAAVRETCEELGLDRSQVQLLGPLDVLVGAFPLMIAPFVGRIPLEAVSPNPDEVAEVFVVPLRQLYAMKPQRFDVPFQARPTDDFPFHLIPGGRQYKWRTYVLPEYFYFYEGKVIWGLTARILRHFLELTRPEAMHWLSTDGGEELPQKR